MTSKYGMMSVICAAMTCLLVAGCARVPEKLISPAIKIEPAAAVNNAPAYKIMLSAGLQNENSDIAFINLKGNIFFKEAGKSGAHVFTMPFGLPVLLPFDTGIIELDKTCSENEIMPLLRLLGTDRDRLAKEKALERSFADDETIGFELTGYEKKNILDVLKDKVNEKN